MPHTDSGIRLPEQQEVANHSTKVYSGSSDGRCQEGFSRTKRTKPTALDEGKNALGHSSILTKAPYLSHAHPSWCVLVVLWFGFVHTAHPSLTATLQGPLLPLELTV